MREGSIDYCLLFEASPDVLLVLLPDAPRYTMVAATRARLQATQTTREQTIGRGLFELFPDNPDDPEATGERNLRASLERVIATKAADTMPVQKYDIRRPDGTFEEKYWSPKNLPVLSPTGELLYILHRVEDVTELVRASEMGEELRGRNREMEREVVRRSEELAQAIGELREANTKLGALDVAKTTFFSNVSHEFRTPLTLMLGPIEESLSDRKEPLGPQQKGRLTLARDNALRLLKLVNALLDFSRLEAGRLRASYAPLQVAEFTAELAGMFQSAVEATGIRLTIDCPTLSGPVWVDRDMWEKIVPNLVSNAFKFTHSGEIAVRMREEADHVVLDVSDTGVGIPEAELPKIFERFHRVAGAGGRTHEGAGIGLSLVRELVELHGGQVRVESTLGRGTTFRVTIPKGFAHLPSEAVSHLPVGPGASRDATAHVVEAERWTGKRQEETVAYLPSVETGAAKPRARVLVVDDNADLRAYVSGLLSPAYDVSAVSDGLAGLEAIRARVPDIVVSDVMMPGLDGFGLVRALRADVRTASLPVILLSARAGEESAVEGLEAGADDYLVKPFSARELFARVHTHVELARARQAYVQELERTNRELDAFSYSVSHDLRAPLRAIHGFGEALLEEYGRTLDARAQGYLDHICRSVKEMNALIDDLLALARINQSAVVSEHVDLAELAEEVIVDLKSIRPERRVEVEIDDQMLARGDRRLLRVALVNLLGNAWKFTSKCESAHISVGRHAGEDSTFFVRDNGAGFDMAYASRLFSPFHRLHGTSEFEGTGLGLATVQRVICRHGGRIWADAEVGHGATFYFSLPEREQATT